MRRRALPRYISKLALVVALPLLLTGCGRRGQRTSPGILGSSGPSNFASLSGGGAQRTGGLFSGGLARSVSTGAAAAAAAAATGAPTPKSEGAPSADAPGLPNRNPVAEVNQRIAAKQELRDKSVGHRRAAVSGQVTQLENERARLTE
jgi:hypothetical protein